MTYVILFLDQLNGSLGSPHRSGWCPGRDRDTLGHITKRGPKHPRSMLVQGAAALLIRADRLEGALGDWVRKIKASGKKYGVKVCAIAAKLARIAWRILREKDAAYRPQATVSAGTAA